MQVEQLLEWDRLAGSPLPSVGRTSSNVSSLDLESVAWDSCESDEDVGNDQEKRLDSAIHIEGLPQDFCFAFFVRESSFLFLRAPSGLLLENRRPVLPVLVYASKVTWLPRLEPDGNQTHEFRLETTTNHTTEHVATLRLRADLSLDIVHADHSPIKRAAGVVHPATRLVFPNLPARRMELLELFAQIEGANMYLPTSEVILGAQMTPSNPSFLVPQVEPSFQNHELAVHAHEAWQAICTELAALSALVVNACRQHNASEFARVGAI